MITMILLGLVFLAVVVPQALSARTERQKAFLDSIQFHAGPLVELNHMTAEPAPVPQPRSAVARRKAIFVLLLVSMAVSALPAVVSPGKVTLVAQLAVDNCFLAYVGLLVRWRDARFPTSAPAPAPDFVLPPATVRPVLRAG